VTIGEVVPQQELASNMAKRKVKGLDDGLETPRRSSRRISTANELHETSKPAPTPKRSKKTEKNGRDEKTEVNAKQEEDAEVVSTYVAQVLPFGQPVFS
jgi:hypothetical protein